MYTIFLSFHAWSHVESIIFFLLNWVIGISISCIYFIKTYCHIWHVLHQCESQQTIINVHQIFILVRFFWKKTQLTFVSECSWHFLHKILKFIHWITWTWHRVQRFLCHLWILWAVHAGGYCILSSFPNPSPHHFDCAYI